MLQWQPAPGAPAERHVFVSYSHRDGGSLDLPRRFVEALGLLAISRRELGLAAERIFFDRRHLLPGDDWDESIVLALERAHLFVLLVSQQSMTSPYCIDRELALAAGRGIPIIPVLLTDCYWRERPVPGDPRQRPLGAFDAVPKNDDGNAVPVSQWADVDSAFRHAIEQIARRVARDAAAGPTPPPPHPRRALVPPLLPYRCDQEEPEKQFVQGLRRWRGCALLVLMKGSLDDNLPRFWERLRSKALQDCVAQRQVAPLEPRPLAWPQAMSDGKVGKDIALDVAAALSDALTGNSFLVEDGIGLAAALAKLTGVLPLMATPQHEPAKGLSASLRAALDLIESTPADAPLDRLVIAMTLEDPLLLKEPSLVKLLKLGGWQRTQVVELDALRPVRPDDVRRWHLANGIEATTGLDDEALVARVFADDTELRLRRFDQRVRPLLGIG